MFVKIEGEAQVVGVVGPCDCITFCVLVVAAGGP